MPRTLFALVLLLLFHTPAHASPVTLDLVTDGSDGSFGYSYLHHASSYGETVVTDNGPVDFYMSGAAFLLTQKVAATADVTNDAIVFNAGGTYQVGDGSIYEDLVIHGGSINFEAVGANEFGTNGIETNYGTFSPLNRNWVGNATTYPPNTYSYDEGFLSIWANNWNTPNGPEPNITLQQDTYPGFGPQGLSYVPGWGLDYVVTFVPTPEPGTALLLGGGLLALGASRKRC